MITIRHFIPAAPWFSAGLLALAPGLRGLQSLLRRAAALAPAAQASGAAPDDWADILDVQQMLAEAEAADRGLFTMVAGAAGATLALALAAALV